MIHILTTGGTIEGIDIEQLSEKKLETKKLASIETFLYQANVSFRYKIHSIFKKDSREITKEDRNKLLHEIHKIEGTRILITHGTFTMEKTAKFLGEQKLDKIIILVGSFTLGNLLETDAPFNLGFAIAAIQLLKPDVYVAMNGNIFHWSNVTKNIEINRFETKRK